MTGGTLIGTDKRKFWPAIDVVKKNSGSVIGGAEEELFAEQGFC